MIAKLQTTEKPRRIDCGAEAYVKFENTSFKNTIPFKIRAAEAVLIFLRKKQKIFCSVGKGFLSPLFIFFISFLYLSVRT